MKRILLYMKKYKLESILGPLFKLLEASFELLVPLVIASMIDEGITNGNRQYIIKMSLVLVSLAAIGLVCSLTAQYFAAKAAVGISAEIRHSLFSHLQKFSYSDMDKLGTSTMITRMTSDVNQVQSGINLTLRLLLRSPFVVFGAMIMAFTVDVRSALVFAVAIFVLCVVVFSIMLLSLPLYKKVQRGLDRVLGITRENLTGRRVIRAFGNEENEKSEFNESNSALTFMQEHVGKISALMNPLTFVIINLAIVALLYTGAFQVNVGELNDGDVVALYNYMSQILIELIKLANLIIMITKSVACANRISAVLDIEPSMQDGVKAEGEASSNMISFRNVFLKYNDTGDYALEAINFSIERGQTVGIIGGTGSGKTSLVNLVPRFYDASKGEVLVDGVNVREYKISALREKIGVVPQKSVLFAGTIRDNLLWGRKDATDEELWEALEIAQAKEFVSKKENGLDFVCEQNGQNLSGGQRQRLAVARALVKRPEILILDDSSSALDYATDAALRKALSYWQKDRTTLIVSQRAASLRDCDIIVVLDDGKIVGKGTHAALMKDCEVYREIAEPQLEAEVE